MIRLTDGRRFTFIAHDRPAGDVWTAAGVPRPVKGDIELLLAAREGIGLLDLRTSSNFAAAEQAVAALGNEEIDALFRLAKSSDRAQRAVALFALNYVTSPRLRREQRMTAFVINPADVADSRAAADHPRAAELRAAALAAFDDWNQGATSTPDWSRLEDALFESLGELADPNAADHLAAALRQRTPADNQAEEIMEALEHFYSLPPLVEPLDFCPTGESRECIARAAVQAQARREDRRTLLLAWHDAHRGHPRAAQATAAMAKWEALVNGQHAYNLVIYPHNALRTFRPLLREGAAIRPELETAKQKAADPIRQGAWEMLIALATGTHDGVLLDGLAQCEPQERELAGKIREVSTPR
jgi:hypothetical protein